VAVAFHVFLVFAVGFKLSGPAIPATTLEVTLAQHRSQTEPQDSDYIAQYNQEGSGSQEDRSEITTDRVAPLDSTVFNDTDVPIASEDYLSQQSSTEQELVASTRFQGTNAYHDTAEIADFERFTPPQNAREISSLRAKLSHQRQIHSKIPRTLVLTTASAKQADEAEYLRHWIEWVERIGNENYPEEARRKQIFGAMRLAVALERDGNVAGVEILQSSGQRVLDQAAVRIVRLAAPFKPFPPSIAENRIEVIRTWNFVPGNLFTTSAD
jgi:periplasmic protein TonB